MATLTEEIELPGGVDAASVSATVELWGVGAGEKTFDSAGKLIGGTRYAASGNPWTVADLVANDALLPAGTVYKVTRRWPGLWKPIVHHVTIPAGSGTYTVKDLLVDEPASVESAALAAHAADTDLHGAGLLLFSAIKSDAMFQTTSTAPVPVTGWSASMTVPSRPFEVVALTNGFTTDANVPGQFGIYAQLPVTAAQRVGGVVTLTLPAGHGIQPGIVPLVDLANNSYDLATDVGVPGNAITAVTSTTVRYNQAGGDLGTSTGTFRWRVSTHASIKHFGQFHSLVQAPYVLWLPTAGLAVDFVPHLRSDNVSSAATVNCGDLGAFGNGPNYAVMYGRTL